MTISSASSVTRVFLTGASGFIGAHVARLLIEAGVEVAALITPGAIPERLRDSVASMRLIRGRLADISALRPEIAAFRPEACIHLAWYAEPGKYLYAAENVPMLQQSLNLLDLLIQVGCPRVVMVGTCAEYDTDVGYLREDSPTRPATIYAATKLSLGLIGQHMAAAAGVKFAWARLFYPYGPMEDPRRMVPALIGALRRGERFPATPGEQVRDYIHAEDVATALWALAAGSHEGIFNVSSGVPITIRQLMETIGEIGGRTDLIDFGTLPYRQWEPMFICGDNRKLRGTGWTPKYTLRGGLEHTAAWWERQEHASQIG